MKFNRLSSHWLNLSETNQFLKLACLALVGINGILVIALLLENKTLVLVPPHLNETMEVAQNKASEGYKKSWGLFAASLLGNVSPDNADFVLDALKDMVSNDIQAELNEQIRADLESLKAENVSISFEVGKVAYEPDTDKVFVTGKSWISGAGGKSSSGTRTFEFKVAIKGYTPVITHLAIYADSPHDQATVKRLEAKSKAANQ